MAQLTSVAPPQPRIVVLVAIGAIGGLFSGMFGGGGGIIVVPLLIAFAGLDQRRAAATSLLAILPSAIAGSITYLAHGEVDLLAAGIIAIGAIGGSLIGTRLLRRLPLLWLRWGFIALLVGVAVRLLFVEPVRGDALTFTPALAVGYVALGLVMGIASGLFGIGGGMIAVPALVGLFGVSDLIAKGTSLTIMIPTSAVGTVSSARGGLVEVRSGLVIGLTAAAASVVGSFVALGLPARLSTILFAILLAAIAVQLTVTTIRRR